MTSPAPAHSTVTRAALALALAFALLAVPTLAQARPVPDSFADLVDRLSPAVVAVSTEQVVAAPQVPFEFPPGSPFGEFFRRFFGTPGNGEMPEQRRMAGGSGFIIDADGYIVTNNHVIANADTITVTLQDTTEFEARVIGTDPSTDVALIKIDTEESLPTVTWGDSDAVRVGDWTLAIGNPFGLYGSVTAGIISARARTLNAGPYDDFFQTDASINPGNSGGPLFDIAGEVIGINTAIVSPSGGNVGIGFAIPSALAQPIIKQIREHGRPIRGWLGVQIQGVTEDLASGLGVEEAYGALVAKVSADSPAERAGLETGDLIVGYRGNRVEDPRALARMVAATPVGADVEVEIVRAGERQTIPVTIAELEQTAAATPERGAPAPGETHLGLSLAPLTPDLAERYGIDPGTGGVLVVGVKTGSAGDRAGIQPGDVIVEMGQHPVHGTGDIAAALDEAQRAKRDAVLILIERRGEPLFLAAPLGVG
jgi:serine protease Do